MITPLTIVHHGAAVDAAAALREDLIAAGYEAGLDHDPAGEVLGTAPVRLGATWRAWTRAETDALDRVLAYATQRIEPNGGAR